MVKVAIVGCGDYSREKVQEAVFRGIDLLGGIESFVQPGEKILLKPNILVGDKPEKCSITHPEVLRAVGLACKNAEAVLSYGDSPGYGSTQSVVKNGGYLPVAEELGMTQGDFSTTVERSFPEGLQNRSFSLARAVVEVDGIISISKMKTHALQRFTGAVKNQFGCIPGLQKGEFHVRVPNAKKFARMLADLNACVNPRLYIMDGIWAMEGNGPRGGDKREMKVLLFSVDPYALDATANRLMNLNPEFVPTNVAGYQGGYGSYREEDIQLVGDDFEDFFAEDFVVLREDIKPYNPSRFMNLISRAIVPKPVIQEELCVKCGICRQICPASPKALVWDDKSSPPVYRYQSCIRCYCCQEMCPESAIVLKEPFLRRLFIGKS